MRKIILTLVCAVLSAGAFAQTARQEILQEKTRSGSNYYAYPGPSDQKLMPAPKGYTPYYISHYGRHGSRYLIGNNDYETPFRCLTQADSAGILTPYGKDVLRRVTLIRSEAEGRHGELTRLGGEQHKGIAKRMMQRFPEVFKGKTNIDAKSTTVIRCILSMENFLHQMLVMNPELDITHDASKHDMYYMNYGDEYLGALKKQQFIYDSLENFYKRIDTYDRVMDTLFTDTAWVNRHMNAQDLNYKLFHLASNVQSTELRHILSLYDLFTDEELYQNWRHDNAWWYMWCGNSPLSGSVQPYSQRNLLRKIIEEADSCLAFDHPGATLRFGHDTMVLPLVCLMNLNGYGKIVNRLEDLDKEEWCNYRIFPMACNLQWIFYRKKGSKDILFKILLNENEATLPLKTDIPGFYHWQDFKDYYLKLIADYEAKH